MLDIQYVSLGGCCSAASTLDALGLRKAAFPFDWIVSGGSATKRCLEEDFANFFAGLQIHTPSRVRNVYGFLFPHDFPTISDPTGEINGETTHERQLAENWKDHIPKMKEKYERRINRFREVLVGSNPIIFLRRGFPTETDEICSVIKKRYKNLSFRIVNAHANYSYTSNRRIIQCNPERDGAWNDDKIWEIAINQARSDIEWHLTRRNA